MRRTESLADDPFQRAFHGTLTAALRWHQLNDLWRRVLQRRHAGWYLYTIDEAPPSAPADPVEVARFIATLDRRLRLEHREDYCGIVYSDDPGDPSLVKIYHPKRLGVVCGFSDEPPLPGWVLSLLPPSELTIPPSPAALSRRWWAGLLP